MARARPSRRRALTGTLAALAFPLACSACSGGGSSPAAHGATPAPTATAGTAYGSTVYQLRSVPSGLNVTVSNGSVTAAANAPFDLNVPESNTAYAFVFAPKNGASAYTFFGEQRNDGTHELLYNQNADTTGAIASVGNAAIARASSVAVGFPHAFSSGSFGRPKRSATRLVIRYRAAVLAREAARVEDVERAERLVHGTTIGPVRNGIATRAATIGDGTPMASVLARLAARADVESAAADVLEYVQTATAVTPDDTHFDDVDQWYLFRTGTPNAWGYTEGDASKAQIAIVDTGADFNQRDLSGTKITYAESVVDGVTAVGDTAAQDTDGHGTNVAGLAAADTNNGFGFAGAAYDTGLQIYKVFADDSAANGYAAGANASDVTAAIYDAVSHGARVINLSLGSCQLDGYDASQEAAIAYAIAKNVVVVAAAGNERGGGSSDPNCTGASSTIDFPAAYPGVVSVGATGLDDASDPGVESAAAEHVASYSNSGPGLTLVAPGGDPSAAELGKPNPDLLHYIEGLYSTTAANPNAQCSSKTDCRAIFAGTSQAAPQVSAVAALVLAENPSLDGAAVTRILTSSADDIGDPLQGSGRLDAYRALAAAAGDPNPPAAPAKLDFVAFAYQPNGTATPHILDVTFPAGVPVASDGTFRIVDIPSGAPAYKIGVWSDVNGDGVVDAGDYFAASGTCAAATPCASAASLHPAIVTSGFVLP